MKVKIDKNITEYTLSIQSGHFSGTLTNINEESMRELYYKLGIFLGVNSNDDTNKERVLVWNPRSQRHEYK